jgi:hypothetical protein
MTAVSVNVTVAFIVVLTMKVIPVPVVVGCYFYSMCSKHATTTMILTDSNDYNCYRIQVVHNHYKILEKNDWFHVILNCTHMDVLDPPLLPPSVYTSSVVA